MNTVCKKRAVVVLALCLMVFSVAGLGAQAASGGTPRLSIELDGGFLASPVASRISGADDFLLAVPGLAGALYNLPFEVPLNGISPFFDRLVFSLGVKAGYAAGLGATRLEYMLTLKDVFAPGAVPAGLTETATASYFVSRALTSIPAYGVLRAGLDAFTLEAGVGGVFALEQWSVLSEPSVSYTEAGVSKTHTKSIAPIPLNTQIYLSYYASVGYRFRLFPFLALDTGFRLASINVPYLQGQSNFSYWAYAGLAFTF